MRTRRNRPTSRAVRLSRIAQAGRTAVFPVQETVDAGKFLTAFYAAASDDDLEAPPTTLAAAALDQLRWAGQRRPGRPKVRVFNPTLDTDGWSSPHTIIETVTDDSPFLVDSVTMQIGSVGEGVVQNIHPILAVARDRSGNIETVLGRPDPAAAGRPESWMHIAIPRIVDETILRDLRSRLVATLRDVALAVRDWKSMLGRLAEVRADLEAAPRTSAQLRNEMSAFIDWLADDHFTFLGYCEYRTVGRHLKPIAESGLGLLRPSRGLQALATGAPGSRRSTGLHIAKAPIRSTVHRPAPLDDVSIAVVDAAGRKRREHRFLGLFTSVAYTQSPDEIPLLRMKTQSIMADSGLDPVSHHGKALRHILDTLPRDELLQASAQELSATALGVLALEERRRTRAFVRLDSRKNFYSCLVYLPRNRFVEKTRARIEAVLAEKLGGTVAHSQVTIGESALARIEITIAVGERGPVRFDAASLDAALADAATSWPDRVRAALLAEHSETVALNLYGRYGEHFPLAYQEAMSPERAVRDIGILESAGSAASGIRTALDREPAGNRLHFTVARPESPVPLYQANPILEYMGLRVISEHNYRLELPDSTFWIQDFVLAAQRDAKTKDDDLAARFRQCFVRTLEGEIENDGFNSLVVNAALNWREADLLRAYCKYLRQTGLRFSQRYVLETLTRYAPLCRALVGLFRATFDPDASVAEREALSRKCQSAIRAELDRATSLDDDRILRAFVTAVQATLRTNFYQLDNGNPKACLSFKLEPARIPDMPRPRPKFEIFVFSRRVEGVHLRCGTVARGGLRWSDRREDFRTEVLGLMKAQQVKNTVIVPTGAKGGFVCKQLPENDRAAIQDEVRACYRTFLRGLLDITDNIVDKATVPPPRVLARDAADPYLVVAADKGTASFSDIANAISQEYGFWLGDAFASGGSAGYDHKKMGITARGAWESVKRHFRELGVDVQKDDFTVVGIGDMSGDVFGNGMLLSPHTRLVAAFNHLHIFIDPEPEPARSLEERRRLFALPRSSWEDYDRRLISSGGGIYRRDAKSIAISAEAKAALGIEEDSLAPPDLIRAILRAPVDLLWNGGIGTYVKASTESDLDAGDPVNDPVRISGKDLRCRVVGEGGNLGLTQLGRIEYARSGGHINTDFIDNSGGVDSSDREVNIKILLSDAIERGLLKPGRRNALLAKMTDDVAAQVLANNYAQTQALSMMSAHAAERLGEHARLIRLLEGKGLLDRGIEFLPSDEQIDERRKDGVGLTRPELAVVLSYAKIDLYESLVASDIPDEPHCASELVGYFPPEIGKRFAGLIPKHRLAREIVAMLIASSMVNRMGPFFALRAQDDTGATAEQIARAYAVVRALFGTRQLWLGIEALDGQIQAQVQYDCFYQASRMVRRAVYWLLHRHAATLDISTAVGQMGPGVKRVQQTLAKSLCGYAKRRFDTDAREYENLGLPLSTAQRIASLRLLTQMLDIVELATAAGTDAGTVARLHFELGRGLRLDWIREQIESLESQGHWRAMARATLRETLGREQQTLVSNVLRRAGETDPHVALAEWMTEHNAQITRMKRMFDEMQASGQLDFATLSIALKEVSRLS